MLDVSEIVLQQAEDIHNWHNDIRLREDQLPLKFIQENNYWNYQLWHEEDIARVKDIDPARIVEAKRNIDHYNQQRNNSIENIDEWILNYLIAKKVKTSEKLHSETPGMMIDRLSIMSLKIYHMSEEAIRQNATNEHRLRCKDLAIILKQQIDDLANCLSEVLNQLEKGELKFKVYRQLKMYNDPSLNPQLYNKVDNNKGSK
ncbi:MAG: hypothetical protein JWR54_673 [Mucilaginibacter sp.]|nr:hypothetical protein [Mucilaginibacter sp.]